MGILVWLDDDPARDPDPKYGFIIVRTADEAIELLQKGNVELITLDHDLRDFRQDPYPREVTGYHVVQWMVEYEVFPRVCNVHSFNPSGTSRMVSDLYNAGANTYRIQWSSALPDLLMTALNS